MDKDAAAEAFEILKAEDFYSPENKAVYEAAFQLYTKGEPIDVVTVKNQLEENGVFAEIGGVETLANIAAAVGSSVNVKSYAKIVEEKSVLRRLIKFQAISLKQAIRRMTISTVFLIKLKRAFSMLCKTVTRTALRR